MAPQVQMPRVHNARNLIPDIIVFSFTFQDFFMEIAFSSEGIVGVLIGNHTRFRHNTCRYVTSVSNLYQERGSMKINLRPHPIPALGT